MTALGEGLEAVRVQVDDLRFRAGQRRHRRDDPGHEQGEHPPAPDGLAHRGDGARSSLDWVRDAAAGLRLRWGALPTPGRVGVASGGAVSMVVTSVAVFLALGTTGLLSSADTVVKATSPPPPSTAPSTTAATTPPPLVADPEQPPIDPDTTPPDVAPAPPEQPTDPPAVSNEPYPSGSAPRSRPSSGPDAPGAAHPDAPGVQPPVSTQPPTTVRTPTTPPPTSATTVTTKPPRPTTTTGSITCYRVVLGKCYDREGNQIAF